jgi:hypothetical protein
MVEAACELASSAAGAALVVSHYPDRSHVDTRMGVILGFVVSMV